MQVKPAPNVAQAIDEIQAENELALLIEGLGNGLIAIAEDLRGAVPFVAVENRLVDLRIALSRALTIGGFIKREEIAAAVVLIREAIDPRTGSHCPNCGNFIGDLAECDKCFHSL